MLEKQKKTNERKNEFTLTNKKKKKRKKELAKFLIINLFFTHKKKVSSCTANLFLKIARFVEQASDVLIGIRRTADVRTSVRRTDNDDFGIT